MLKFQNLSLSYDAKQVFENISCTVPQGNVLAIVGKSGCGKSSLLRIIAGLEMPQSGDVHFRKESILKKSGIASFMQQEDLLLPYLKALDNVALPLRVQGVSKKLAREKASVMLAHFDLNDIASFYPQQLSGGMRQRIALLRACIASPALLLLDEPFSKLDAITKDECQQWSQKVWQEFDSTVVLVTHDITEAITLADFIAVLGGAPASFRLLENTQSLIRCTDYKPDKASTKQEGIPCAVREHIVSLL